MSPIPEARLGISVFCRTETRRPARPLAPGLCGRLRTPGIRLLPCITVILALQFFQGCGPKPGPAEGFGPAELRCEYVREPLGLDRPNPRLFWIVRATGRGKAQSAYQILVSSDAKLLGRDEGDLWNTGKVSSDQTTQVSYAGRRLRSFEQVFWKARIWDETGRPSAWSAPAHWTMGLLDPAGWQGEWIGAVANRSADSATREPQSLLLRREFKVKPGLRRALACVCGLGCYEMTINGGKIGDALFPPGWTKYDKTCLYDTYDITASLRSGENAIGLLLGNGMYNVVGGRYTKFTGSCGPLKAIAQLRFDYEDGSSETIGTDRTWRIALGPLTFSCVYGGEDYDARREPQGWNRPGFNATGWEPAIEVAGPGGALRGFSCAAPPIRTFEVLAPGEGKERKPGTTIYDLGQNVSLMPRIKVRGAPGDVIRIRPAELLKASGELDRGSCGGGEAYWQYTLAGQGEETWFPKFFYHGCRYLEVERLPAREGQLPAVESVEGVVVHSAAEPVGTFECSSELFNRIHRLVRSAQRSNMMSVMTDCPHREKLGWLEEDHLNGPSLRYEFDLAQLFTKMMNDMADSQLENGLVPDIAPEYVKFDGGFRDSPEWGSAFLVVAWQQYEFTGDLDLLGRYYEPMRRYVDYLGSRSTNHIVSHGLGDWYDLGPNPPGVAQLTPVPLTATAFYYYDSEVLARAAALLGKANDAKHYRKLAAAIRDDFNRKFFDKAAGRYATGSQCANSIPLVMELAPREKRASVLDCVVSDVRQRGNALTAGDVGYRYLLRALADGGRSDVIFEINNQSAKPGYGYQLRQGATSLTEAWDAGRGSSQNHFMLGQINEWFYHDLAGIQCAPDGPGFKKIIIRPALAGDLKWVKATYKSIRGQIETEWRRDGHDLALTVVLPANTAGRVFVPARSREAVGENSSTSGDKAVRFVKMEDDRAVFELGSGRYEFHSRL